MVITGTEVTGGIILKVVVVSLSSGAGSGSGDAPLAVVVVASEDRGVLEEGCVMGGWLPPLSLAKVVELVGTTEPEVVDAVAISSEVAALVKGSGVEPFSPEHESTQPEPRVDRSTTSTPRPRTENPHFPNALLLSRCSVPLLTPDQRAGQSTVMDLCVCTTSRSSTPMETSAGAGSSGPHDVHMPAFGKRPVNHRGPNLLRSETPSVGPMRGL